MCNGDCFNCKYDDCVNDDVKPVDAELTEKELLKAKKKAEARERKKAYMKRYYQENKDRYNRMMNNWRKANPNYNKEYYWKHKNLEGKHG